MATRSLGTTLNIVGANNAKTKVAGLKEIGGLELSAETIDTTTLDSDGGYREFIAGFKDAGEVALSGNFIPEATKGQKEIYDLYESGEVADFSIDFPNSLGASWTFKGIVTAFGTSAALEDPLAFTSTIKVSGKPTLTIGGND